MPFFFQKSILILILLVFFPVALAASEFLYFYDSGFDKFGKSEYPNTFFSHGLHSDTYQIECKSCHHIYDSKKNIWQEDIHNHICSDCHGNSKAELVNAHHMNCWGCHKRIKQEYEDADTPTADCKACHIPEDKVSGEETRIIEKTKKIDKKLFIVIQKMKKKGFY